MVIKMGVPSKLKLGYMLYSDLKATEPMAYAESNIMQLTLE